MCDCKCSQRKPNRLYVGDILHGFAQGAFGRDDYDCKVVDTVSPDGVRNAWIILRYLEYGEPSKEVTIIQDSSHEAIYEKYKHALEIDIHCQCG